MLRNGYAYAALLIASAVGGVSCVSGHDQLGVARASVIGGDADPADTAVVALVRVSNGTLCTGTVIAPTIVLTAAHCVFNVPASDLEVLIGSSTATPDQTLTVASVAAYPTYDDESDGVPGGVDLGVVVLSTPTSIAPAAVAVASSPIDFDGVSVTVIGYGVDDATDDSGAGVRREVSLSVTNACSRLLMAGDGTSNACFGDSGGAVMLKGSLVAVVSGGSEDCDSPTNLTRLDAHAVWLASVLAGNVSAPCPACVAPDSSCTALAEGQTVVGDASIDSLEEVSDGGAMGEGRSTKHGGCALGRAVPTTNGPAFSTASLLGVLVATMRRLRRGRRRAWVGYHRATRETAQR